MCGEEERSPQNGWADRKMIVQVARLRKLRGQYVAPLVRAPHAETDIGFDPIFSKIEIVLDQERTIERVVANSVAAHPGIDEWQRKKEQDDQDFFVFAYFEQSLWASSAYFMVNESETQGDESTRDLR